MNADTMISPVKDFADLDDSDVAAFLRDRPFRSEGIKPEFRDKFPEKDGGYDIREICKYIVGLSNEQGGLLVYGVSDSITDPDLLFPEYVVGLSRWPSEEDLSIWAGNRIYPLLASLSLRHFVVEGRTIVIVRVPAEANKPYCYYDPVSGGVWYFRRMSNGIGELPPEQIRAFYVSSLIEQVQVLDRASVLREDLGRSRRDASIDRRLEKHWNLIKPKLENIQDFGFLGIYCLPTEPVDIPLNYLARFLTDHRNDFSQMMRYYPSIDTLQNGSSVGFFPRLVRQDVKSTCRVTLYQDGLIAFDSQADPLMEGDKNLHPYGLAYEIQRHLQLSKAVLEGFTVSTVQLIIELENIENFVMDFSGRSFPRKFPYSGAHQPVRRDASLADVYSYDGDQRNIAMPVVRDVMDEICRIFGVEKTPAGVWDQNGRLAYVAPGLESQR
jgi:hypothetical protein